MRAVLVITHLITCLWNVHNVYFVVVSCYHFSLSFVSPYPLSLPFVFPTHIAIHHWRDKSGEQNRYSCHSHQLWCHVHLHCYLPWALQEPLFDHGEWIVLVRWIEGWDTYLDKILSGLVLQWWHEDGVIRPCYFKACHVFVSTRLCVLQWLHACCGAVMGWSNHVISRLADYLCTQDYVMFSIYHLCGCSLNCVGDCVLFCMSHHWHCYHTTGTVRNTVMCSEW